MIKISKNRNNIFNIGKRRRRYTAKTNSGNLGSVWLNNSIVKAKKRLAQKKREEAREQREKERQKKREASQRKARERASKIRANKRQREREKEKRLEIKRINKNKIDKLVENQTSEKLSETLINSKEKEILISENERLKELENKKKIKEQKKLKLEIIKKEKLELEKKRELEKKKELERKISSFIQKKIKFLMSKNKVKNLIKKYIHKDEVIKFIDYGTLNISSPSPTGYLILTDKRFLFHSKVLFLKESLTEIPLSDVLGVNFDKSLIKTNIVKFKIKDQKDLVFKDLVDNLSDAWNVEENSDFSIQYLKLKFNQN